MWRKIFPVQLQLNPDNSNLQGSSYREFELSRVKLIRKGHGGESKKVLVSGRFELLRVRAYWDSTVYPYQYWSG